MTKCRLRKTIIDVIEGYRILLDLFYWQPIYVGDSYVEYECMKLKRDDDAGKMFFIFSEFSSKGPIELNTNFGQFLDEILVLLHKPMKPRSAD